MNFPKLSYKGLEKRIKNNQTEMLKEVKEYAKKFGEENFEGYYETKEFKKKIRKIHKAIYLKDRYSCFEKFDTKHLLNHFRNQPSYDTWYDMYIFDTDDLEKVKKDLEEMYVEIDGSEPFYSEYDCTGRTMWSSCKFYQFKNRTFVCQSGSLDV